MPPNPGGRKIEWDEDRVGMNASTPKKVRLKFAEESLRPGRSSERVKALYSNSLSEGGGTS